MLHTPLLLHQLPTPKALLFDFDGVIAASKQAHGKAWQSAAQALWNNGIGDFPPHLRGRSPKEIAYYFSATYGNKEQAEVYMDLKLEHLLAQAAPPPLLTGAKVLLQQLSQGQLPFGIASNAPRPFVLQTLERHGLFVVNVLGLEDYTQPKPAPEPYLKLAQLLGIPEEDFSSTWIFEDSVAGMHAARDSGMCPIGVVSSYSEKELVQAGARTVINNLGAVNLKTIFG